VTVRVTETFRHGTADTRDCKTRREYRQLHYWRLPSMKVLHQEHSYLNIE